MKSILTILWISCLTAGAQNFAVTLCSGDSTGIPDGWPKNTRPLGEATGPLSPGEQLKTQAEIDSIRASLAPQMEARNMAVDRRALAPLLVPLELRKRVDASDFAGLKVDALQSEFLGILLHAYLQTTELLQLVTKAVAGTAATNQLSAAERARVVALRGQLAFPQQDDLTKSERDRAVEIRDGVLKPHYELYQAAKAFVDAARTNGLPADFKDPANWPTTQIRN